ncbi:MAG: cytochrome c [Deltaproteobacteria bacterium]|nr:cytochrome c [Deltaproteobacteria bacterium]
MPLRTLTVLFLTLFVLLEPQILHAEKTAEMRARQLINALGCKGCHKLEGSGGSLAPELDNIGSKLTREQISQFLAAPESSRKNGFMPSYDTIPPAELKNLSDFLYNLH